MAKIVGKKEFRATDAQKHIYFGTHAMAERMLTAGLISEGDVYHAVQEELKKKKKRRSKRDH